MTRRFRWRGIEPYGSNPVDMKRWAVLTVLLYALALLPLTVPVSGLPSTACQATAPGLHNALRIYLNWGYWLWLGMLVAGQALLLLLPVNIAERRPPARGG